MKKGWITGVMLKRFPVITRFAKKNDRLPFNSEVAKMFNLSLGETTKDVLDKYKKSLSNCVVCGKKL